MSGLSRDDIIRLAREAGWPEWDIVGCEIELERFAALVAAAEREKAAKWLIQKGYTTGHGDTIEDLLEELVWLLDERVLKALRTQAAGNTLVAAVEAEREECAKVCDEVEASMQSGKRTKDGDHAAFTAGILAERIRARGQQENG